MISGSVNWYLYQDVWNLVLSKHTVSMNCAFKSKPKIIENNLWVRVCVFHYFSCLFANLIQSRGKQIHHLVIKFDNFCLMCDKIVLQSTLGCMAWNVVYKCRYSMLLLKWHLKTTRWLRHKRQKECRKLISWSWFLSGLFLF